MNIKNSTIDEFIKNNANKRIICFGAGKLFKDMFITMEPTFLKCISCVIDSNINNQEIRILDYKINIINFSDIKKINIQNSVFLITSMYCYSIYKMLSVMYENIDIDCYIYTLMSMTTSKSKIIKKYNEDSIPKIIHYCWFGGNEMPYKNKKCIESWKEKCPDYKIIRWDESNYDVSKNEYMNNAYKNKKWGFVPDFARLDIIYNFGGIYLDTDVEMIKPPSELLKYDGFMGFQRNFWINLGLGFGAKKNNSLIRQLRDEYFNIKFIDENGNMNMTASPYYQTSFLKSKLLKCNNELQYIENNIILPTDYLDPQGYKYGHTKITENTISIHHYDESWVESKKSNYEKYDEVNKIIDFVNGMIK